MQTKLMKIEYIDTKAETHLEAYADTIVIERDSDSLSYIAAIRFGGYPESVKGMGEAVYGGGSVSVVIDGEFFTLHSRVKQYRREYSHDGIYAEATLMVRDEEPSIGDDPDRDADERPSDRSRKCYLFCEQGDRGRLFEELDKKTGVPLIPEFQEYILSELQARDILKPLQVISVHEKFDAWLSMTEGEKNIISAVNDGLKSRAISIPGSDGKSFPAIRSVSQYLNTFGIITGITELQKVYEAYGQDNKTCYAVMSKEKARDGYMKRPAVLWNQRRKAFLCPDCHKTIEMDLTEYGSKYRVPADALFFKRENKQNHKCGRCGSLLWTALIPEQQSEWVKVSKFGFVHRKHARGYLKGLTKKPALYDAVKAVADNPDGHFPNAGAYRRFPLSAYIKKQMHGKIDGLIVDELHNYNNNSGQGDAMGELFQASRKVVGMTATLINGYSSGIFHLLYRIAPDLMLKDGKKYGRPADFNNEYGVTQSVYEIAAPDYNSNRRTSKRKIREKQLPGVSPLVYSRFLMDSAAFLSLNDMGKNLPEYEEIPIELQMDEAVAQEYYRLEHQFKNILRSQKDISQKVLSAYLGLLRNRIMLTNINGKYAEAGDVVIFSEGRFNYQQDNNGKYLSKEPGMGGIAFVAVRQTGKDTCESFFNSRGIERTMLSRPNFLAGLFALDSVFTEIKSGDWKSCGTGMSHL